MTPPSSRPREARLFRNNRSQAVRIPVEFELPGDRVLIRREGEKLIIEPFAKPATLVELLAAWQRQPPLGPKDQFPEIEDSPATPETIF
ncbi:antitoxin [Acidiphilium acidophilum]|uniref:antitoxin n=1 Tax=Acidiphilium acidophilum TaxID=76588 RepID=UPI0038D25118